METYEALSSEAAEAAKKRDKTGVEIGGWQRQ